VKPRVTVPFPPLILDLRDPTIPRYRQLYLALRKAIRDGVLPAGFELPSSRAMAQVLGISRSTVVESFNQLAAEGYITGKVGRALLCVM
jgi:DNA-binding GntR family transcriptional regulator